MLIEEITQMAKDTILKNGQHMPMVYCEFEGSKEVNLMALPDIFSSDEGRVQRFFSVGRMMGTKNPDKDIASLAFIAEAWMSRRDINDPNFKLMPSQDPNRMEVLIVNTLDIVPEPDSDQRTVEQGMHVIEMLRDGEGNLMDLLQQKRDESGKVHSRLLTSFLSGFTSTKVTEEQMVEIALKTAMERGISEEEAHRLVRMAMTEILKQDMQMIDISDASSPPKSDLRFRGNGRQKKKKR